MPAKVMLVSAVPSPTVKASPAVLANVSSPFETSSVTATGEPAASTSVIEIGLPPPVLKTSGVSSGVEARPGIVISGASLTAVRLTVTESQPHCAPPAPVAPLSVIERSRMSVGAGESEPTV